MKYVRVVIEYWEEGMPPSMRWERQSTTAQSGSFNLLGRAFEVAQREEGEPFAEALCALFQGALAGKEDVAEVLAKM